jgi:hypothetical protein
MWHSRECAVAESVRANTPSHIGAIQTLRTPGLAEPTQTIRLPRHEAIYAGRREASVPLQAGSALMPAGPRPGITAPLLDLTGAEMAISWGPLEWPPGNPRAHRAGRRTPGVPAAAGLLQPLGDPMSSLARHRSGGPTSRPGCFSRDSTVPHAALRMTCAFTANMNTNHAENTAQSAPKNGCPSPRYQPASTAPPSAVTAARMATHSSRGMSPLSVEPASDVEGRILSDQGPPGTRVSSAPGRSTPGGPLLTLAGRIRRGRVASAVTPRYAQRQSLGIAGLGSTRVGRVPGSFFTALLFPTVVPSRSPLGRNVWRVNGEQA